ncbi:MAG TPA: GNAT family N-acetyltransferase [Candidatus Margulisiibacteriota bacterium]|nr:GNAT family N-acetyltransferase [Candidatus Margulisiibacteriota bacterium]
MQATSEDYVLRDATLADVTTIARHRVSMFRDIGMLHEHDATALETGSRAHLTTALADGTYRGWVIEYQGAVVAGTGVILRPLLPRPESPRGGEDAEVLNVYTERAHRRRGLARRLVQHVLSWARARGLRQISLHASDAGRPLYEQLGFVPTNEMRREWAAEEV